MAIQNSIQSITRKVEKGEKLIIINVKMDCRGVDISNYDDVLRLALNTVMPDELVKDLEGTKISVRNIGNVENDTCTVDIVCKSSLSVTEKVKLRLNRVIWKIKQFIGRKKEEEKGITLPEVVDELVRLYDNSPKGEGFVAGSPQTEPVRKIGYALNAAGGKELMLQVHAMFSQKRFRAARNLEMVWDGIGSWMG